MGRWGYFFCCTLYMRVKFAKTMLTLIQIHMMLISAAIIGKPSSYGKNGALL